MSDIGNVSIENTKVSKQSWKQKIVCFFSELKASFESEYISDLSPAKATGEFLKLAFAPFYLTLFLGVLTLLGDSHWDGVFLTAIDEFMQLTGLKLCLYILFYVIGFSFLLYQWEVATKFFAGVVRTLSHTGFAICAILAGVTLGIAIPACVDADSFDPLWTSLVLFIFVVALAGVFYISSRVFCSNVRKEINSTLGRHTSKFTTVIGIICIAIATNTMFFDEKWKGTQSEPKECRNSIETNS
jgi:glucan phosphoethanolaminetransferase (alkaline phosphatase superfamily)